MTSLRIRFVVWLQDKLLRRVIKNTAYLFSSNTLAIGLNIVQSVFAARLLGPAALGVLAAVTSFSSSINRLLSFRMGELVVKYVGQSLAQDEKARAASVLKAAALTETMTSVIAYSLLVLLAPFGARVFAKDISSAGLFSFYALALLANFATETAIALLQVGDRFRSQAVINLGQALLTAGLIVYAFLVKGDIKFVVTAYLVGKVFYGLAISTYAFWRAGQMLGRGWWRASFKLLPPTCEFWKFAASSNFSATVNLVVRDSEILWVNYFLSPLAGGYYKIALAVINLITMPINPFISTSFPELARAVAQKAWQPLRDLLRKLSILSGVWTALAAVVLVFFGEWVIGLFYGQEFLPAAPAVLILLVGFGLANICYWNRPLLLSLGDPVYPLKVMAFTGITKILLSFWLVPRYGYLMQAALLSGYFVISIGLIVWRGFRLIGQQERLEPGKA
ncbi:MAG: oligosaccharide flippase family protein [Anaerolineales bacterium]|nr:oligosaccharide flippase family protein [Anaerolineales bacterium]